MRIKCCSASDDSNTKEFEEIKIEKVKTVCSLCEDFAKNKMEHKVPIAILSCEGACLRGEVSRQVANQICFIETPTNTSRICLGGAFTKNTGQRMLVRKSQKVIALEGCSIKCASRMMKAVIPELEPEVIMVDQCYDFDTQLFGVNEVSEDEIKQFAQQATSKIMKKI